ncbi:dihydrodipicolinate synthase family protein [Blastopirellula sp. JC732]|uniref:Dihydrodipicolinate synthase family protein n=1 Tax=Blastopirellula sediminis TaxID=2894196 RepID=A0A9X1MN95_9BACT|nr:dihydrodipicolinate synthase family protein [Blastopirellula sediminis]MCC9608629.1 dihydrodipicolinate synthase family protein [Blastopirellula sediminis]MCC9628594.1 dihydrodipicolinate synthase family protein [Blastopirellula sediminis]
MDTKPLTTETISRSVWAVPSLARNAEGILDRQENAKIIRHIEQGGISTLLYGGNAIFYHLTLAEYRTALELISTTAADDTLVIPAIGPAYGTMLDQAEILLDFNFPTVMLLPQRDVVSSAGIAAAIRKMAEKLGKPIVLYLKYDGTVTVDDATALVNDGVISAIKYAVVRKDYTQDDYLRGLTDQIDKGLILSGLGDQPAIVHMRDFGLGGFTTGCGCIFPQMSAALLKAIQAQNWDEAEAIRERFLPLERLRDNLGPISILHRATELSGIAKTGPIIPLLSEPGESVQEEIAAALQQMS